MILLLVLIIGQKGFRLEKGIQETPVQVELQEPQVQVGHQEEQVLLDQVVLQGQAELQVRVAHQGHLQ